MERTSLLKSRETGRGAGPGSTVHNRGEPDASEGASSDESGIRFIAISLTVMTITFLKSPVNLWALLAAPSADPV